MTISEVLVAKIPEGKYKFALNVLKQELYRYQHPSNPKDIKDSLCAAFEELSDHAMHQTAENCLVIESAKSKEKIFIYNNGRAEKEKEILGEIEQMEKESYVSPTVSGDNDPIARWCSTTLRELKRRIEENK